MTGDEHAARHIVVTGAASGIGAAISRRFAGGGDRLTLVDQQADALNELAGSLNDSYGTPAGTQVGDLADADFAASVLPVAWERSGPVDVAVVAAGIYPAIPFLELTTSAWDRVQAVNVRAALQIVQQLAVLAIGDGRQANVVFLSSGAAQRARPGAAAYCASKAALEMLTRSAALELGQHGIRVNAVSPGFVDVASAVNPVTRAYAATMSVNPLGRPGRAEDIANAVHWVASDAAGWVTGSVIRVDGGSSAGALALPAHWAGPTAGQLPETRPGEHND